ncbi:uncharacterized protein LOC114463973 isoform X12 [Gouania willdenowi]|uniref:uncharacterized protein LOC114463973 isoform X12 n=1 Tax=Gouania willdenowi TaxID=441366 RepID=UPI001054FB00|nr:uncharacterized protein LOC114463973 isoform X12 [Gouania willdenowi]
MNKTRGGFKHTMSGDLKPPGGGGSWRSLPRTQAAVKKHQIPEDCLHCGASVLSYGHFLHKAEVYCEGAEGLGKTLGLWLSDRKVSKTTRWRLEKTFDNMKNGNVPGPNIKTCKKCGQIISRETGHSVLRSAREAFCQRSDPKGRTVDQWLTEKRGGITSSEMAQRATKLANERQRRYRRMQAKNAERDKLTLRKRDDKKDEEKQENKVRISNSAYAVANQRRVTCLLRKKCWHDIVFFPLVDFSFVKFSLRPRRACSRRSTSPSTF